MAAPTSAERAQRIVCAVGELHLDGNILPHEWFRHLRYPNGKPHTVAMIILSEIVYWYRPRIEKDEQTGRVLGYYKRFKGDTLQRSQPSFAEQFGFTLPQVRLAMDFLEEHAGVIRTELRDVITRGGQRLSNVLFIEVVPERLRAITIPPGIQLEELLHADRSSVERSVDGQRAKDDPSDLQIVPSDPHGVPSDPHGVPSD
ncbi:MAG: hypothetical protein H0X37_27430, partial [Herpetosiphonaceae bacterium]|nr:hypothetical protein [Herpetosiphonaceae bacterium]